MKALIDSDIFQWEFGNATDNEGKRLIWPWVQARVQGRIDKIMQGTQAHEYQAFLTSDDKSNFRYKLATILPYKGNRDQEKPFWYKHIRNFLVDFRGAKEIFGMEADDAISIEQWKDFEEAEGRFVDYIYEATKPWSDLDENKPYEDFCRTIICSLDKDLDAVPGWHYNWRTGEIYFVTEMEALQNFYCQLLTGDRIDNILGLFGVGKSSKYLDYVRSCDNELDMYLFCRKEYYRRFGSYADQFLLENARLLWMKRTEDDEWNPPRGS